MHSVVVAGSDTWLLSDKLRTLYMPGHISGTLTFPVTCSVHRTFPSSNLLSFCLCYQSPSPFLSVWCKAVSSSAGTFSRTQGKGQLMSNRWLLYFIEGHSTDTFRALFTCVAHDHAQSYNMTCGDRLPVWLTGWPYIQNVALVEEILNSQPVKNRNTGAAWILTGPVYGCWNVCSCMGPHRGWLYFRFPYFSVTSCAVPNCLHWAWECNQRCVFGRAVL